MTVRGSCAMRGAISGAITRSVVVVFFGGVGAVWQAAARHATRRAVRFMRSALYYRQRRDHRVHELSRAVPVRRGALRAQTVEKDQVREVRNDLRDSQPGIRTAEG